MEIFQTEILTELYRATDIRNQLATLGQSVVFT